MTQEDVETFAEGIPLKDFTCQPAKLELVSIDTEKNQSQIRVTIAEGSFIRSSVWWPTVARK